MTILETYHNSIATLVTGGIAWFLYVKAKRDEIKAAAKIVILEIKEAEKVIKRFTDAKIAGNNYPTDFYKVTPYKAWDRYAHLFIKKLNNDEYEQVNEFYKKCEILEKYIEKNYNFFWVTTEERARQKERIGADYSLKLAGKGDIEFSSEKPGSRLDEFEKIAELYMSNTGAYLPQGIKDGIDKILSSLTLIINTPTWNSLKKIAKYKDILG